MAEAMSELERVLRTETGIHFWIRGKMIRAYESDTGRVDLPEIIERSAQHIAPELLPRLRALAADGSQ